MRIISATNLQEKIEGLLERQEFPAISIYLNTHRTWKSKEKAKITLKNQLGKISDRLIGKGFRQPTIDDLFLPINRLISTPSFWKSLKDAIVFFVSQNKALTVKLTKSVPSKTYVDDYFNIKYLTEYLYERENYYILAVSPKKNYLYEAENRQVSLFSELDFFPTSLESISSKKEGEKSIQHHSTKPINNGTRGGMSFHGHGAYKRGKDILIEQYLESLDNNVNDIISDYKTPLVLVSTESIYSHYKKLNTYPNLLKEYVGGNPDNKHERNILLRKAWPIVKKELESKKVVLLKKYRDNYQNSLTELTEIVRAAYYGSVDKLFVGTNKDFWGKYSMENGTIRVDVRRRKDSQDLVNLAVVYTIKNGGEVYKVGENILSSSKKIGAILRY